MKKVLVFGILLLAGIGIYKSMQQTSKPKTIVRPNALKRTPRIIGNNTANPNAK